jgi:hypothetical protein
MLHLTGMRQTAASSQLLPIVKITIPSSNPARDSVMLTLEIKAPASANSFSFDAYFFSADYSAYVCTQFNDLFVALLDSAYSTYEPEFQNPSDKNLAVDENGNSLGINFVMSGLFTVCKLPDGEITDINKHCEGSEPLSGTGYENHGATGWLKVTRKHSSGRRVQTSTRFVGFSGSGT